MAKLLDIIDLPPVWLVACIGAAWALATRGPIIEFSLPYQELVGWGLIGLGLLLGAYAVVAFWRFKTSVIPRQTPSALINQGPYRWSRNPIYLADMLVLAGCVVLFGAISAALVLPLFWAAIHYRFILPEEQVLRATFGTDYTDYCSGVRRWI